MKTLSLPNTSASVTALAWDLAGQRIAGVCDDGMIVVWKLSGDLVFTRRIARSRLLSVAWSEHGRCLIAGGEDHTLSVIQACDGAFILSHVLDAPVTKIAFAPRGRRFLVAAGTTVSVYTRDWHKPMVLAQSSPVLDIAWSPTGGRFAVVCQHEDVFVYNVLRRQVVYTLSKENVCGPRSIAWNVNGCDLAIGTTHGTVHIHDGSTGDRFTTYSLSPRSIRHLAWGNSCLAALDDQEITLWDLLPREQSGVLAQHYPSQRVVAFSPNGAYIATGSQQTIYVDTTR